jgi:putative redox protein
MTRNSAVKTQRLRIPGSLGYALAARLDTPDESPRAYALFAHCFTCTKDLKAAVWLARALTTRGWAVLRFDFTGIGDSDGQFAETTFSSNLDDVVAAADYLREHFGAPVLLFGHSLGGTAALAAARRIPEARAVVTLASPSDLDHFRQLVLGQIPDLIGAGQGELRIDGRRFSVRRELLEDLDRHDILEQVGTLGRALLVVHSQADATVPFVHAERLIRRAKPPKALLALDRADHLLLSNRVDAPWVGEVVASWAMRYLDGVES